MDNYETAHVGPAHLQRVPMKREYQKNGKNIFHAVKILKRCCFYSPSLTNVMLNRILFRYFIWKPYRRPESSNRISSNPQEWSFGSRI